MIRAAVIGLGLLLAGGQAMAQDGPVPYEPLPSPVSATCDGGLCQPEALRPFFAALAAVRGASIAQWGDSHTATGWITEALRRRLAETSAGVVTLTADGEVGATLYRLADRDPGEVSARLATAHPDLIILAYGTNEGFDPFLSHAIYETRLRELIARLRAQAPGAAILMLGAPEAMRAEYGGVCPDNPEGRWAAPAMLAVVRDVQHRVAADLGVAYWDWFGRMGGDCSAHRLTQGWEPLMRADHVHFNELGADWIGGLLYADLMAARDKTAAGEGL